MTTDKVFVAAFGCTADASNTGLVTKKAADVFKATHVDVVDPGALPYMTVSGDTAGAGTDSGLVARYQDIYDDHWGGPGGNWVNRALPAPGNHDEGANGHAKRYGGYWDYWDGQRQSGAVRPDGIGLSDTTDIETGRFWYDVDLMATDGNSYWKLVSLNDEALDNTTHRNDQLAAFQGYLDDAEANGQDVMVIHHQPLIQLAGNGYGWERSRYIWDVFQRWTAGRKIIVNAHIHSYTRFKPLVWNGATNFDTDPTHGVTIKTETQWKAGDGIIEIVSGLGGQDPFSIGDSNYWAAVADEPGLLPNRTDGGANKAVVIGPAGVSGEPPDSTTDADGQVGHPYGITGLTLGPGYLRIQFYGNKAPPASAADVTVYDDHIITWVDDDVTPPGGAPTITSVLPLNQTRGDTITITGTDFGTVAASGALRIGQETDVSYTVVNATRIDAVIPATVPDGQRAIQVTNSSGTSLPYTYQVSPDVVNPTAEKLRPSDDIVPWASGAWSDIDEVTINDADAIRSDFNPVNDVWVGRLSTIPEPGNVVGHTVRVRVAKSGDVTGIIDMIVEVRQGYVSESNMGTLIESWPLDDVSANPTTYTHVLTNNDDMTDHSQQFLRIVANRRVIA